MNVKRKGFTLIELLVVIAIIAILAAILFPVFAKARDKALLSTCINNEKQLGTAFMLYTQDTNGRLPMWMDPRPPDDPQFRAANSSNTTWDVYLFPYVKAKDAFRCPANKTNGAKSKLLRSYSLPRNVSGMPISYAKAPTRTVLLMEKGSWPMGTQADSPAELFGQTVDGATSTISQFPNQPGKWGFPHNEGKVFLFLDGHVKWFHGIYAQSDENPFGYYFANAAIPPPANPRQFLGFCGDKDPATNVGVFTTASVNPGDPPKYGANLPY